MFIGKKWKIESDSLNITLLRKVIRKPKDKLPYEDWEVEGYFRNVANALKGLVDLEVKETELKDLQTVAKKIDELEKLIDKALKGIKNATA